MWSLRPGTGSRGKRSGFGSDKLGVANVREDWCAARRGHPQRRTWKTISSLSPPEVEVISAIIDSAKIRFDYDKFKRVFARLNSSDLAEDVLFMIVAGFTAGHPPEKIATLIGLQFPNVESGLKRHELEGLIEGKNLQLKSEIRALAMALKLFGESVEPRAILNQVKKIFDAE